VRLKVHLDIDVLRLVLDSFRVVGLFLSKALLPLLLG
jgi:hypothetical protein